LRGCRGSWLRAQTKTIPLVVIAGVVAGPEEMVTRGLIQSQEHPGGNVTGIVGSNPTLWSKRLDLLHETVPSATHIGALMDSDNPVASRPAWISSVTAMIVRQPSDLDRAFAAAQQDGVEALAVAIGGGRMSSFLGQVAAKARQERLPAICDFDGVVTAGGLMSYAPDSIGTHRDAARLTAKILGGTSPADVPVELATSFGLRINRTTATAIGLDIPASVLAQATEVVG
jgi:putative ABC transport system substrate-binding protein